MKLPPRGTLRQHAERLAAELERVVQERDILAAELERVVQERDIARKRIGEAQADEPTS